MDNHKGNLNDPEFNKLFLRLLSYRLNGREIKYLIYRFYFNMNDKKITKFEGGYLTRAGVNFHIQRAYRKIIQYNQKL